MSAVIDRPLWGSRICQTVVPSPPRNLLIQAHVLTRAANPHRQTPPLGLATVLWACSFAF